MLTDRRMDGQTDMTQLIVAFRSSANAPVKKTRDHVIQCETVHLPSVGGGAVIAQVGGKKR